jgi:hypothetical protein
MPKTADIYTKREKAIAKSVVAETRAHIGRKLTNAILPCDSTVSREWLEGFAQLWMSPYYNPARGNTDYLSERAIGAAEKVTPSDPQISYPSFHDNRERAISREGKKIVFAVVGSEIEATIRALPAGPVDKQIVVNIANDLQKARKMKGLRDAVLACAL